MNWMILLNLNIFYQKDPLIFWVMSRRKSLIWGKCLFSCSQNVNISVSHKWHLQNIVIKRSFLWKLLYEQPFVLAEDFLQHMLKRQFFQLLLTHFEVDYNQNEPLLFFEYFLQHNFEVLFDLSLSFHRFLKY